MSKKNKCILAFLIITILIMYGERTFVVLNHWYKGFIYREIPIGNVEILEYANNDVSGDLIIPDEIRGNSVTVIGNSAFMECFSLTSVTIPEGVTSISNSAFQECHSLTSVTIPDSVTSIGKTAFFLCRNLTDVTIPENTRIIGYAAFEWCDSLTNVTISNGVKIIDGGAFGRCYSLKNITIPSSVASIGYGAFDTGVLEKIAIYNPKCEIDPDESTICDTAVIYGYEGSTAQAWAKEHDRTFKLIDEYVPD